MSFLHPELLLLLLPALWVWWRARDPRALTQLVRLLVLVLAALALAGPYLSRPVAGRDLVVVVDRSRSMRPDATQTAMELVRLAEDERRAGDRVGVVAVGARVAVERLPAGQGRFTGFEKEVLPDGSDLGGALESALSLIEERRSGGILLISDGEGNGADPLPAARRAFARGVRIDTLTLNLSGRGDLSVERLDLPETAAVGEPFQFSTWVRSDRRVESEFSLERAGRILSSGRRVFEAGLNRLVFRDAVEHAGVADYRVRLGGGEGDRRPENNVGLGALRVEGARAVLVLNDDGAEDTLVRALRSAGIPAVVSAPEAAPLDRLGLAAFRAVVLENVAAERVARGMVALRDMVTESGGGLLMSGGRASFGIGGYHLSGIDRILPVSMEMRQESRKQGIAVVVALDRSGSMSVGVAGGGTKMDLANLGASAVIELLSQIDSVGVVAVDSAAHVIQELTPVVDAQAMVGRVRRIRSEGGGIFVRTALAKAGELLDRAEQQTRHVILFADAADSEEQEGVPELLERFERAGITVSVIALGTPGDQDAAFLEEVAHRGRGEVYFTSDPTELPRLFAQDTMVVARSTFVTEPTAARVLPDLFGLGELAAEAFPQIAGYNLSWLRPGAVCGVVATDEYRTPLFAFSYQGIGRTAAFAGQIGGEHGGEVVAWEGFAPFFVTAVRWLLGQEEPRELFATVRREGMQAVISVEADPEVEGAPVGGLEARMLAPGGGVDELVLERVAEHRWEGRWPLVQEGIALGTVRLADGRFLSLPPIALPYSPEFERSPDPHRGERTMREIAELSGGEPLAVAGGLFRGERQSRAWRPVSRELALAALLLLLLEIAGRRLLLWELLRVAPAVRRVRAAARRVSVRRVAPVTADAPAPRGEPIVPEDREPDVGGETSAPPSSGRSMADALRRARRSADRKLGR